VTSITIFRFSGYGGETGDARLRISEDMRPNRRSAFGGKATAGGLPLLISPWHGAFSATRFPAAGPGKHFVLLVATSAVSVIECFETDGGVNYRSDRLILF